MPYRFTRRKPSPRPPPVKRVVAVVALGLVLLVAAAHAWFYAPFISDDALISLRYAERLLDGQGLTWTDGERVEGYTDLAWVLLTALLGALQVDLIVAARGLGLLGAAGAIVFTALAPDRPASISTPRVLSGSLMLALTGPLAVWSIGGLEHGFQTGVLIAALWLVMRQQPNVEMPRREFIALEVLLVLLALLRADGAVLIGGLLIGNLVRSSSWASLRRSFLWGLAPLAALLVQLAFRRVYYDAWVPNTALVKVGFSLARVDLGLSHLRHWFAFGGLLLAATGLAVIVQVRSERRWVVPLVTSVLWAGYLVTVGGDIFPAWRQWLLGLAPLGLVIAEGGQTWWERTRFERRWLRWSASASLLVVLSLIVFNYQRAQRLDPQNKRGNDERWEFEGYSLGPFLREAWGPREPLLAVDAAGALPYFSKLPSLDLLGLNDRYIATHPPPGLTLSTGHELGDGAYVWTRKPDILAMCGAGGGRDACFLSGKQFLAHPQFAEKYQLMRYHSPFARELSGELWIRREDGPLGIVRGAERIVVPGWLLAQASGRAELNDGRLRASVTLAAPAHLVALGVPAGRWRITAGKTPVQIGVLCEGRSAARSSLDDLVLEMLSDGRIDVLVGSSVPAFVDELVLERTPDAPQVRCDPAERPQVLEVDAAQLRGAAVEGAYFLQPHGLKLSPGVARIRLGPSTMAKRYEISVDGNDLYLLRFRSGDEVLGDRKLPERPAPGLTLQQFEVPAGTEVIEIEVSGGDGSASIGHLVLFETQ